jgi:hypothetical protein
VPEDSQAEVLAQRPRLVGEVLGVVAFGVVETYQFFGAQGGSVSFEL